MGIQEARKQYKEMKLAYEKNRNYLKNKPTILRDLLQLEDLLINAGLLEPRETKTDILIDYKEQKQILQDVLYSQVSDYFPQLLSPQYD